MARNAALKNRRLRSSMKWVALILFFISSISIALTDDPGVILVLSGMSLGSLLTLIIPEIVCMFYEAG